MSNIWGRRILGDGSIKSQEIVDFTDDNGSFSMCCGMNCELFEFISFN